jgi:signal transduction histidine kinase
VSAPREVVLGQGSSPAEDDLRLPKAPGVIRQFWARHPRFADILIAVLAFLLTVPILTARGQVQLDGWTIAVTLTMSVVTCAALVWRRRWPLIVFAISMIVVLTADAELTAGVSGPAPVIALYTVAVYRGARACWIALGVATTAMAVNALVRTAIDSAALGEQLDAAIGTPIALLLGALIGVNVGNRRRYLEALIDRSRQLVVERDQQARLAAAAERARIAREMHDIVSHSLTVVVALAEGATATADPERAREASRAVAATARDALGEMRMMLGVLRSDSLSEDAPLGPILEASLHDVVDSARAAGLPVTLTVAGDPDVPAAHRLAVLRIVQEAITNALRYAPDAGYVRVRAEYSGDAIRIVAENDGARPGASEGAGWGLQGLRERVASLGGSFSAGLVSPGVWRLSAELPREDDGD